MAAENIWARIDPTKINTALSLDYLEILEPLLGRPPEEISLKDDKYEKSQIYKMTVLHKLRNNSFRKMVFSYLTRSELTELSRQVTLPRTNENEMRDSLLAIPWDNNPRAIKIADFIGVPRFMLEISSEEGKNISDVVCPWVLKYDLFLNPVKEDKLISEFAARSKFKTLKSYQALAHQEVLKRIGVSYGKCILNMPTGTGKTRTAMEVVCSYLMEHPTHSVVWVAHTRELLDQAALEFSQLWEFLGERPIKIIQKYAGENRVIPTESVFIATSFQTLIKNISDFSSVRVGLIVVDEAHMTTAKTWGPTILKLKKPELGTKILGLTATPVRSCLNTKELIEFYDNNLVQLKCKSNKPIFEYLIEARILAKPKYDSIDGAEITLTESQIKRIQEQNTDFSRRTLDILAKHGSRNLAITKKLKEILGDPEDERQILFFGASVEHSKMIATWLIKNNYSAFHLDARVSPISRKSCINAFKSGKLRVLCNYGVLSTGFDVPKIDCLFISRPTTSHVLHSQMIGRGLRGPKLGGTPHCLIVEVKDNIRNFAADSIISFEKYQKLWEITPEELRG